MQIELELLAPAKNRDIGIAAIDCGADAVYIAGPKFGARESAGNSIEEIAGLVTYANKFGVKVYMVINTIIYDSELEEAIELVNKAYEIGCSAIIVQDLALTKYQLPPIPLFASTQTNIRKPEQARFLEGLGFKRLILARELSLQQINEIKESVDADIETFIHGALCVSYSGQCYLSQRITGRSANRGACAQACRSLYTLADSNGKILHRDEPLLSLKDFNLSKRIPQLVEAGVTSFKIEGRLKNISYIKNVVKLYREELDRFIESHPEYIRASAGEVTGGFRPDPLLTFNRGYTTLFIDGKRGRWRSEDGAKYLGEPIGKIIRSSNERQGILKFVYKPFPQKSGCTIANGDGLCFVLPNGEITGARANSCNGTTVTTTEKINVPSGATLYRNYNIAFERELEKNMPQRAIPVELEMVNGTSGIPLIRATWRRKNEITGYTAELQLEGDLEPAQNRELAKASLFKQLGKGTGIYRFELKGIAGDVVIPFLPVGKINELRRTIAARIDEIMQQKPFVSGHTGSCICKEGVVKQKESGSKTPFGETVTYLANCSNKISRELYMEMGAKEVAPAYELERAGGAELMRTKYCLKYDMGLCPNYKRSSLNDKGYINRLEQISFKEPLYLLNGENKLELKFDCANCEMVIIG